MREKGVEPSLRWNWCLKPARLPFRHSRTETLFIVARFAAKVNCRRIIPSLRPHNNPKNSEGGHGREENAAGKACGGISAAGSSGSFGWLYSCLPDRSIWSRDKPYIFPALHGRAAARPWKPECRQHPGGGQLPDDADAGRVAPHQNHPGGGDRAAQSDRLWYTVRRQDVSEGALIVGFSEIVQAGGGTSNPAKEAGLRSVTGSSASGRPAPRAMTP